MTVLLKFLWIPQAFMLNTCSTLKLECLCVNLRIRVLIFKISVWSFMPNIVTFAWMLVVYNHGPLASTFSLRPLSRDKYASLWKECWETMLNLRTQRMSRLMPEWSLNKINLIKILAIITRAISQGWRTDTTMFSSTSIDNDRFRPCSNFRPKTNRVTQYLRS